MNFIGGFFELESELSGIENKFHADALPLNYGRSCFNYIIQKTSAKKIYVPYYTCDSLLQPLISNKTCFEFYEVDEDLCVRNKIKLSSDAYFVYVNYFGLKGEEVSRLSAEYGPQLIIDNTQSFFYKPTSFQWSFNSARKFFGVPDGAFLYSPKKTNESFERNHAIKLDHLLLRKQGKQEEAYRSFSAYENSIDDTIKKISSDSERILSRINFEKTALIRRNNFNYYHQKLKRYNQLKLELDAQIPLCYPFIPPEPIKKGFFYENGIFIPSFWNDVIQRGEKGYTTEKLISENLLPLPVDHRYGEKDCERVIKLITKLMR